MAAVPDLQAFEDVAASLNSDFDSLNIEQQNSGSSSSSSSTSWADCIPDSSDIAESSSQPSTSAPVQPLRFGDKGGIDHSVDAEHEVVVRQADGSSDLYSAATFAELKLRPEILSGIYNMGWSRPSSIQGKALPLIIGRNTNMISQAQSGTGKTGTFAISMLMKVDPSKSVPQAICMLPTIELARQVAAVVAKLASQSEVKIQIIVKGEDLPPKITAQIIVGTPGKISDALKKKHFDPTLIKIFVLDEADQLISSTEGFSLSRQVAELRNRCKSAQILCFSATFPQNVREFARRLVPDPVNLITLKPAERAVKKIQQIYIECGEASDPVATFNNKARVLGQIYKELIIPQSMIFVATRKAATALAAAMTKQGFTVSVMTGENDVKDRTTIFEDFASGKSKVLISTNLLARGIDIRTVTLIVNFDLPTLTDMKTKKTTPDVNTYLHRVGRTGRFGNEGLAINLISTKFDKDVVNFFIKDLSTEIPNFPAEDISKLQKRLDAINQANDLVMQQTS